MVRCKVWDVECLGSVNFRCAPVWAPVDFIIVTHWPKSAASRLTQGKTASHRAGEWKRFQRRKQDVFLFLFYPSTCRVMLKDKEAEFKTDEIQSACVFFFPCYFSSHLLVISLSICGACSLKSGLFMWLGDSNEVWSHMYHIPPRVKIWLMDVTQTETSF